MRCLFAGYRTKRVGFIGDGASKLLAPSLFEVLLINLEGGQNVLVKSPETLDFTGFNKVISS